MKATFLEAEVPLTKTFFMKDGKIEKQGHPWIIDVTSHEREYGTIEELHALLLEHAAKGHSFLKGNVSRPLVKESRASSTNPTADTEVLLLDIDGIKGVDDIETVLTHLKLHGVDYIAQYSSSMGVLPGRGLSAHVFMLLDKPYAPAILKQFLIQWNLNVPLLRQNLGLTRTYNALRWSLDITTCQNDKLIYIAPPICRDGVEDKFGGERITLIVGKRRRVALPEPFPNAETNQQQMQAALNELRKAMGLKERPKTAMKTRGNVEYMASPDRAVVTGIKESKDFVYLNLNGGDSWAYFHPVSNPEFIRNFKNEPVYRTRDLLPDYWQDVKHKMNEVRADAEGRLFLAFRDFRTSQYYNGIYHEKTQYLQLAPAKSEKQLKDFLQQYGQPYGEFVPDWTVKFDPRSDKVVDVEAQTVNTFQRSTYMKMKPARVAQVPSTIRKVILHALGGDEVVLEHFLNWLAVILQFHTLTETAWILHGVTGTGKGLMLKSILRPILGMEHVVSKRMREVDSQFNGWMERALLVWVDEAEQNDFNAKGNVNADVRNFITEVRISIRRMHTMPYEVDNYSNWIFTSNKGHVMQIDPDDRRFNVAVYQGEKLQITAPEIRQLEDELFDFYSYLMTRTADESLARKPLNNPAKRSMILLNMKTIDVAAEAVLSGNLEFFWSAQPQVPIESLPRFEQDRATAYVKLLHSIVRDEPRSILREELHTLLDFAIGGMPTSSMKFTSMLKHHRLNIQPVTRNGISKRGIPVKWVILDEWRKEVNKP